LNAYEIIHPFYRNQDQMQNYQIRA